MRDVSDKVDAFVHEKLVETLEVGMETGDTLLPSVLSRRSDSRRPVFLKLQFPIIRVA